MEPITHLAAGLLTAQALRRPLGAPRGLTALCAVAATIPDADIAVRWFDPEYELLYHRGLTHSLFALPLLALLLAWAARRLGAAMPLRAAFLAACLGLSSHLFLDVFTAFGTQLFAPFSTARVRLDGLFVVDPAFTALLLCLAFLARAGSPLPEERKARLALAGLGLLVAYPLFGLAMRMDVQARYQGLLARRGQAFERLAVTPDALAPYYWKIVMETGPDMLVTTANALDIDRSYPVLRLRRADLDELARLGRQASIFGTFAWFASHPFAQDAPAPDGGHATRYADASFLNSGPVLHALFGDGSVFAEVTAVRDAAGRLTSWRDDNGRVHPVGRPALPGGI